MQQMQQNDQNGKRLNNIIESPFEHWIPINTFNLATAAEVDEHWRSIPAPVDDALVDASESDESHDSDLNYDSDQIE